MDFIVRLISLQISDFKNVKNGTIRMPSLVKKGSLDAGSEIIGIYGQNGSGKTAVIDAIYFMHQIMTGSQIPDEFAEYMRSDSDTTKLSANFKIYNTNILYDTEYTIVFKRNGKSSEIDKETIKYSILKDGERTNKTVLVDYERNYKTSVFRPLKRFRKINIADHESVTDLLVARKISEKLNCSYIFNENSREVFIKMSVEDPEEHYDIISALYGYAIKNIFVIRNTNSGLISANLVLPMTFKLDHDGSGIKGDFPVPLMKPVLIDKETKLLIEKIIFQINIVLGTIIPGMEIGIKSNGSQLTDLGEEGENIELVSLRNGNQPIPLRMESDGIIKIISILGALIQAFGNQSVLLAVDELDAGIFEYMLGELLDIFDKNGKGQLIFTSHNLRPLEMLEKESIIFSTTNPDERYARIKNAKQSNNLRDMYLRLITLGGQKEVMYDETDSIRIARAFRKAWRTNNGE